MRVVVDNGPGKALGLTTAKRRRRSFDSEIGLRTAVAADAAALHALIGAHLDEGRLLPRQLNELAVNASRFIVAVTNGGKPGERIIGCAELAPLSPAVAEVRSLVVSSEARGAGLAGRMVDALATRGRNAGFHKLCAFAHDPRFFVRLGFSIVPHTWVPEKIARDCHACALFRKCGQYATVIDLLSAKRLTASAVAGAARTPGLRPHV